jgi:hypothetical protein
MIDHHRDALDDAIDRVAAELVRVPDDPDAAERILLSLPPRHERPWVARSWPLQAAALASVVLVVAYLRWPVDDEGRRHAASRATAMLDSGPATSFVELHETALRDLAIAEPLGRFTGQRGADRQSAASRPYELPALTVPEQITVTMLQTTLPLAAVEPASIAPIALSQLPLDEAPPSLMKE